MSTKLLGTWSNVQSKNSSVTLKDVDMEVRFWSYINNHNFTAALDWLIHADLKNLVSKSRIDELCEECCKLDEKLRLSLSDVIPRPSPFNITPIQVGVIWPF
jgi:hypothetical protein